MFRTYRSRETYTATHRRRRCTLQLYVEPKRFFFFFDGRRAAVAATCQSTRTDPGSRHIDSGCGRQLYTPHNIITWHCLRAE